MRRKRPIGSQLRGKSVVRGPFERNQYHRRTSGEVCRLYRSAERRQRITQIDGSCVGARSHSGLLRTQSACHVSALSSRIDRAREEDRPDPRNRRVRRWQTRFPQDARRSSVSLSSRACRLRRQATPQGQRQRLACHSRTRRPSSGMARPCVIASGASFT